MGKFELYIENEDLETPERFVRRGLSYRTDRQNSIWDDMLKLFGSDREAAAELFGVRPDVISRGMGRLKKTLDKIRDEGDYSGKNIKRKMFHTGI